MSSANRPTFIGIHTRDDTTQILYISSGCRQAMGFSPDDMIARKAHDFIADPYSGQYSQIYHENTQDNDDGDASAYVMYMNIRTASGDPVLHRVTTFKCDNCVIVIGMAFPEIPYRDRHSLQVQMLDGAMQRLNIGSEAVDRRRRAANRNRVPLYFAKNRQLKAAFVLENPDIEERVEESGARQNGTLITFVTGSVSRIIDADTADLMRFPFLKLVAPEHLVKASRFFASLSETPDVLFETFSLLQRPHIIDGDVCADETLSLRVDVECLGASVPDGLALLVRKLRVRRPPSSAGDAEDGHSRVAEIDDDGGYMSLSEIISSDPETSDAPGWSRLR